MNLSLVILFFPEMIEKNLFTTITLSEPYDSNCFIQATYLIFMINKT